MKEIIEKLSTYNIFNYLFPGVVFCMLADKYFSYGLIQKNIIIGAFYYYFIGLMISRIGSIIIEPLLKKIGFIEFSAYRDFIAASKKDPKIDMLSEVNNMYRTIISLLVLILVIFIYEKICIFFPGTSFFSKYLTILLILSLFLYSYKKQTSYIKIRISSN